MDGSEGTLVPEWYRSSNSSGKLSGNSNNDSGLVSHPDDHGVKKSLLRNRVLVNGHAPRPSRTSSSYRSVSINGYRSNGRESSSNSRAYANFRRKQHNRDKFSDFRDRNRPSLLENGSASTTERDSTRRANSLAYERRVELGKRQGNNSRNGVPSGTSIISKPSFERDFPSLGTLETQPEIPRVSSPGLSSAIASLSKITSPAIVSDGWISALAVPVKVGSSEPVTATPPQKSAETSPSSLSCSTGLSMAEAVAQAPVRTVSQMSMNAKKSEDFTRAHYSKLIPMTPNLNKNLASEKAKPRGVRAGELSGSTKVRLHPSPQPGGQALHVLTKSDNAKGSQGGNFLVLNRVRNGIIPSKDSSSVNNAGQGVLPVGVPAAIVPPLRTAVSMKLKLDKGAAGSFVQSQSGYKRVGSQAQNRNDFFNILRKKTLDRSSELSEVRTVTSLPKLEKPGEQTMDFCGSVAQDMDGPVTDAGTECSMNYAMVASGDKVLSKFSKVYDEEQMSLNPLIIPKHNVASGGTELVSSSNHVVENCNFENNCPMAISDESRPAHLSEEGTNSDDILNSWSKNDEETSQETLVLHRNEGSSSSSLSSVFTDDPVSAPSEEEAAFLRQLGWDENADGDVITPEEIKDFISQHPEQLTSLRLSLIGFGLEPEHVGVSTAHSHWSVAD